jgi:hypothetical protein
VTQIGSNRLPSVIDRWQQFASGEIETLGTRLEDNADAADAIGASPLWGIGRTKVYWDAKYDVVGGQDVHPFLMQGLISGIPGIVLLALWLLFLLSRARNLRVLWLRTGERVYLEHLIAVVPIGIAVFLSAINTSPAFFYDAAQVPFGMFCGLLLARRHQASRYQHISQASNLVQVSPKS